MGIFFYSVGFVGLILHLETMEGYFQGS